MIYYPSGKQAGLIDKYTQDEIGLPGLVLMEKAAETLADEIDSIILDIIYREKCCDDCPYEDSSPKRGLFRDRYKEDKLISFSLDRDKILAVVESGNNGGDAVAAARILKTLGYDTYIYEINGISSKTDSYNKQIEIAKNLGVTFIGLNQDHDVDGVDLSDYKVIIDGIFGVGLSREVRGIHSSVIEAINRAGESGSFVVGTDVPSGISSSTGQILGNAVKCDMTVTFQYVKYGMLVDQGRECSGEIICRDIGLYDVKTFEDISSFMNIGNADKNGSDTNKNKCFYYESEDVEITKLLPERRYDSNKGSYGKVLIIAGSKDIYGALYLSAEACLRSGAGLVKVVTDIRNRDVLADKIPEAMMLTYASESIEDRFWQDYTDAINWADVILAGPGLGTGEISGKLLYKMTECCKPGQKLVLDADALNIISQDDAGEVLGQLTDKLGKDRVVITPHVMEMTRLINSLLDSRFSTGDFAIRDNLALDFQDLKTEKITIDYVKNNSTEIAKQVSDNCGVICVLKDARTIITHSDHQSEQGTIPIYLNTTGNSGMSTAGSGDVLAGIMAGLLAQQKAEDNAYKTAYEAAHETAYETACAAVNIHGRAGDLARDKKSERSMLAGDIIEALSELI